MTTASRAELLQLPINERIQLVEDLWNSIADHPEALPLTDERRVELDHQLEAWRTNPVRKPAFSPLDLERLRSDILANPDGTLEEFRARGQVNDSLVAFHNTIKKLGFTRKKSLSALEKHRNDVTVQRAEFLQWLPGVAPTSSGLPCRDRCINKHNSVPWWSVELRYLPLYSPNFNPIKLMWAKAKNYLRTAKARTQEQLYDAIPCALVQIIPKDIQGFFRHRTVCIKIKLL